MTSLSCVADEGSVSQKTKTKRVRTTFSEEQIQFLTQQFNIDSNPDGQELERIAIRTGLSKRVTQVRLQRLPTSFAYSVHVLVVNTYILLRLM